VEKGSGPRKGKERRNAKETAGCLTSCDRVRVAGSRGFRWKEGNREENRRERITSKNYEIGGMGIQ